MVMIYNKLNKLYEVYMDKTIVIFGAPNVDKTTGQALNNYIERNGLICHYFYDCFKNSPLPCCDCGFCKENSACKFSDLNEFYNQFEDADRVIFAFPVYNAGFPAPLKALIDRLQVYYNARFVRNIKKPIQKHKSVTMISVCGSDNDYKSVLLAQIKPAFTVTNCTLDEYIDIKNTDNKL